MTHEQRFPHAMVALNKRLAANIQLEFANAKVAYQCNSNAMMSFVSTDKLLCDLRVQEKHPTTQSIFDHRAKIIIESKRYTSMVAKLPATASDRFWEICEALCGCDEIATYSADRRDVIIKWGDEEIIIYHGFGKSNTTMNLVEIVFMRGLATRHIRIIKMMKDHKEKVRV